MMLRVIASAVLAAALAACAPAGTSVALLTGDGGIPGGGCYLAGTTGELLSDPVAGTAIDSDDMAQSRVPVMWPLGYAGRQAGGDVEVLDATGHVVARTGTRIHLDGGYADAPGSRTAWLACDGGVSTP